MKKGKGIYKRRKETVERSFADSQNLHGLRYARMRGNENVREQCLLIAAIQNMKKITTKLFFKLKETHIDFLCYLQKYLYNFLYNLYPQLCKKNPLFINRGFFNNL